MIDGTQTDRPRPTLVPSFTANVARTGILLANSRVADLTALVNCEPGGTAHVSITLTQGSVTAAGQRSMRCGDGMQEMKVKVAARGPEGLQEGAAIANLEAVIRNKGESQTILWTREIVLAPEP